MATEHWNPSTAWREYEAGAVDDTSQVYQELLQKCPVAYIDASAVNEQGTVGYWGIFGYDELDAAIKDYRTFSNVTPVDGPRILPLQSDPPEHTGLRRMLNPWFTKPVMEQFESRIRSYGSRMIADMVAEGGADFADEFAFPFPTRVLCTFLGVPEDDWRIHHDWVMAMEHATGGGLVSPTEAVPPELAGRIVPYIQTLIDSRRAEPGDDVVSGITQASLNGEPLDDGTTVMLVMTIMMAGHITTTSAIGNFVARLARDRELQAFLRANPDRILDAVDESLRVDGPQQAMPRKCMRDTEVNQEHIKAGEYVVLNFGSANVDPKHWQDPAKFDIDRPDKRHFTFGKGIHQCIGQHLARLEMRLVVEELLQQTETFELNGPLHRTVWPLTTVDHLPLTLVARQIEKTNT